MARRPKATEPSDAPNENGNTETVAKNGRGRPKKARPDATNLPDPNQAAKCFAEMQAIEVDRLRLKARADATLKRYERSHGVDPATIKRLLAESKKDPAEVSRKDRLVREYRRMLGVTKMQPDGQVAMDMEALSAGPVASPDNQALLAVARAHMDGYNSGLAGATESHNPFEPGTEEHVEWVKGMRDGEFDRHERNPESANVKQANPSRKRREPSAAPDPETVQELSEDITRELAEAEGAAVH